MKLEPNCAYALLKPDVVLRDAVSNALNSLEAIGFRLLHFRIGELTEEVYEVMYAPTFLWRLDQWSHNQKAYAFGPVIGLIVVYSGNLPSSVTAQDLLLSFKGSALPRELSPDSIRARCRAPSRVFNVIHIPNNTEVAQAESDIWFGAGANWAGIGVQSREMVEEEIAGHGYDSEKVLDHEATYLFIKAR